MDDSRDPAAPPPAVPSAQLAPAAPVAAPTQPLAPSTSAAVPPTSSPPALAQRLSTLDVADPSSSTSAASLDAASTDRLPSTKRRRSAGGDPIVSAAESVQVGHRRTPSGRVPADGVVVGNGLTALARQASPVGANAGGGEAAPGGGQPQGTVPEPSRLSPLQAGVATQRSSPPAPLSIPSFPVLPPSQPAPNQTFQTPLQVSSILSLPPPLLLQLARTDSPVEQKAIAERNQATRYLSSMAIPPPSPTTLVNDIARAGLVMTAAASSSAGTASSAAGVDVTSAVPGAEAATTTALAPSVSVPLPLPNLSDAHPALPLLLGQVFSPPTPGVLAPIPGIPGILPLATTSALAPAAAPSVDPFGPVYASVEVWSVKAAKDQVISSSRAPASAGESTAVPPTVAAAPPPVLSRAQSFQFNDSEIASLAGRMKTWALAEQEKQVEQQVAESKAAAVVLAATAQAGEAGDEAGELDLSAYEEQYKKQLDALASGYFAQLHRDALKRLVEEEEGGAAEGAKAIEGKADGPMEKEATATSSNPAQPSPPASASSTVPSLSVSIPADPPAFSSAASAAPSPTLSSSQAPTLTTLTALTSSRSKAEAMHVRASAAAAVAAQVMAAKDLARSAGERLSRLGGDPRRVVEEVVREVGTETARRASRGEDGAERMALEPTPRATGMTRSLSGKSETSVLSGASGEKMAIEDVGAMGAPSSAAAGQPVVQQPAPIVPPQQPLQPGPASPLSAADLAALPDAQAPLSASHPGAPSAPQLSQQLPPLPSSASTGAVAGSATPTAPAAASSSAAADLASHLSSPAVLATLASPQKRDYLLTYAHTLYAKQPQSDELLPLLHTIESMHPDHLPTLLLISCVYYTRGELESSLYYNKRLLEFDPSYVEAMSNIGTTLRAMGKWDEAEKWWWKAIKLRPTYWDATENLLGVLCNPTPHSAPPAGGAPRQPEHARYHEALSLCDYVESQIFTVQASAMRPAVPASASAFLHPLATLPRPRTLPPTVPFNHVHRLQNLFYAKGNLRLALLDQHGAQDEYEKAVEVALSFPDWASRLPGLAYPLDGCTTRDLIVVATIVGRILAAYAQGGGTDTTLIQRTAAELGVADERGGVPFEHLFGIVKQGGDAYARKLLDLGGGVLPTVLLEPALLAQLPGMLFPESRGGLPALFDPSVVTVGADPAAVAAAANDPARKAIEQSAKQTTSTMLLTLAKILQDSLSPTSATRPIVGGLPASQSLLLPLYYVALALYPSPSTCNNLGILLSTLNATTVIGSAEGKPPVILTGQQLALRYYQTGLKLDPRHPHLYTNLGSLLKDMGKLPEAVEMYKQAVQFNPTFDVALANLANAVKDTGAIQESIPYYRRAVELNPTFPEAVCGLVNALGGVCDWAGRGGVGEEWLVDTQKRLIYIAAPKPEMCVRDGYMARISDLVAKQLRDGLSYGVGSLRACGSLEAWLAVVAQALWNLSPQQAGDKAMRVWVERLGYLLSDRFEHERNAKGINEGGYLIRLIERLMRRIQRRWYLDRFGPTTYLKSGAEVPTQIVPAQEDVARYRRPPLPPSLPAIPVPTVLPFHCFTLPVTARETRLISHRTGLRISHSTLNQPWMPPLVYPPPRPPRNGKINLGYVSSDLGNHPLSHLMQSVFGYHDLDRFNVFVYATSPSDKSPYRLKIEAESQHFFDVSHESTQQIVERIVSDEIHILVNLSGYTKGARNEVFAARPAPVQMSYMGFASTLSAGWCDYFIVDPIVCPPHLTSGNQWRFNAGMINSSTSAPRPPALTDFEGDPDPEGPAENFVYTEKLIYLPHSYFVTDHKQAWREDESVGLKPGEPPVTSTLPPSQEVSWALEEDKRMQMRRAMFPNIRDDTIIFANWNQLYKIDPYIFRIWLNILRQHPNSILWLLRFPAPGEAHLKDTALKWAGEEVASRVIFTDVANKNEHIHRGRIADLFLDTTECNAHTTAADILWSGTPILTYPRHVHKMCSRVAASIAVATGFGSQMIVTSPEEYERRALELASGLIYETVPADPSKPASKLEGRAQRRSKGELADLRKKLFLSRESSPLFDTQRWTRNLEKGLVTAWEQWVSGSEFEDDPNWGKGSERPSNCIWIADDVDGVGIGPRQPYF
ncbi:hypothetical protein JCM10207_007738 [Rhodosporidiobolus poonsookiae]